MLGLQVSPPIMCMGPRSYTLNRGTSIMGTLLMEVNCIPERISTVAVAGWNHLSSLLCMLFRVLPRFSSAGPSGG